MSFGPAAQQAVHVVDRAHAATDSERDEHLLGRAPHHVVGGRPITAAGRDIEEGQLVGPLGAIGAGQFNGVAGVTKVLEVDALDDSAGVDVETGDHPDGQRHGPNLGAR